MSYNRWDQREKSSPYVRQGDHYGPSTSKATFRSISPPPVRRSRSPDRFGSAARLYSPQRYHPVSPPPSSRYSLGSPPRYPPSVLDRYPSLERYNLPRSPRRSPRRSSSPLTRRYPPLSPTRYPPIPGFCSPRRRSPSPGAPDLHRYLYNEVSPGLFPPPKESSVLQPIPLHPGYDHDPNVVLDGTIKEYIDDFTGLMNVTTDRGEVKTAFFHATAVWISNQDGGNPYGPPVKFTDVLGKDTATTKENKSVSLEKVLGIGSEVLLKALSSPDSNVVQLVVLNMWPKSTEPPPMPRNDNEAKILEKKQEYFLKEFHNKLESCRERVEVTFNGVKDDAKASVWEIRDEQTGILEVKGPYFKFFAIFHIQDVWLPDGKSIQDVEFFQGKHLRDVVQVGQPVNCLARSIVMTKGAALKPTVVELQAILVSLNPDGLPRNAPKPTWCPGGPGTFASSSRNSCYYFQHELYHNLNWKLKCFLDMSKQKLPELDTQLLHFNESLIKRSSSGRKRSLEPQPPAPIMIKKERLDQVLDENTEQVMDDGNLKQHLTNFTGKVVEHLGRHNVIFESLDRSWRCLATTDHCLLPRPGQGAIDGFPMASIGHFNATLINANKPIQYVASLAWNKKYFSLKDTLNKDKDISERALIKYYEMNDSMAKSNDKSTPGAKKDHLEAMEAIVDKILDDNFGLLKINGGLILFDTCDFWISPDQTASKAEKKLTDVVRVGTKVMFHACLVDSQAKIQYLASSVWTEPVFANHKMPEPIQREHIHGEKVNIYKMVLQSVQDSLVEDQPDLQIQKKTSKKLPGMAKVNTAHIKCMIDENSGILESVLEPGNFCYFELDDLNLLNSQNDLVDIVMVLNNMSGVQVSYQAKLMDENGPVQYLAHIKGVQIHGQLPEYLKDHMILGKPTKASQTPSYSLHGDKISRFWRASGLFKHGSFLTIAQVLKREKKEDKLKVGDDHVGQKGVIKTILNENFGLIEGPQGAREKEKSLALFDTFDLYLANNVTAADKDQTVATAVRVGTKVVYNACFINKDLPVPYLATSLCIDGNDRITSPEGPLTKAQIQDDKLKIFKQVSESCKSVVVAKPTKTTSSQKAQLEEVYQSESYKKYIDMVPKFKRKSRNPKTPDRHKEMSYREWNEKMESWKKDLAKWNKEYSSTTETLRTTTSIKDTEVHGFMEEEVNTRFCILTLSNGSKALLHKKRLWVGKQFGDWRVFEKEYFKKVYVNARKVPSEQNSAFDYQVTFCHAGMGHLLTVFPSKKFSYPEEMHTWIEKIVTLESLNEELEEYEKFVGFKAKKSKQTKMGRAHEAAQDTYASLKATSASSTVRKTTGGQQKPTTKKGKNSASKDKAAAASKPSQTSQWKKLQGKCKRCAEQHGKDIVCSAASKTCSKCGKSGHISLACLSSARSTSDTPVGDSEARATTDNYCCSGRNEAAQDTNASLKATSASSTVRKTTGGQQKPTTKKGKNSASKDKAAAASKPSQTSQWKKLQGKCKRCAEQHGKDIVCSAASKTCNKCGKSGHISLACLSSARSTSDTPVGDSEARATTDNYCCSGRN